MGLGGCTNILEGIDIADGGGGHYVDEPVIIDIPQRLLATVPHRAPVGHLGP